jgi:hypothetical protein
MKALSKRVIEMPRFEFTNDVAPGATCCILHVLGNCLRRLAASPVVSMRISSSDLHHRVRFSMK